MTLALVGEDKTARERLREFLRIYASVNTRLAYATDLGIPLDWVPGYTPPDPSRRRGRRRAEPTGLEWLNWCGANGFRFADVRVEHVERWLDELAGAGYSDATRGRMLSAVSAFYAKYLLREGLATQNPVSLVDRRAQHLNKPAGTPSTTKRWSFQACRALLMAAYLLAEHRRDGVRDRAMIEILVGTGVRADELVGVNLDDYRRAAAHDIGILRVHGKGGKDREVALAPPVADALEDYLRVRAEPAVPALPGQVNAAVRPIFVTSTGRRVHASHLQAVLTRLCRTFTETPRQQWLRDLMATPEAEFIATHLGPLRDTIHPHSARHSYATHAVERGVPPRQVQRDLGHAALATTEGYLHDEDNVRNSAAHELAPALHRGWLATSS
ncbi:tyrosine-type recombinase/integrase [Kutzneria kofuensis]|uniref:Site-specific recombinase XerD n=1 Tax=Kutzneria kofuensis TaxID=103725 RepID=A0A7W9KS75_9PSEU|nr:tyrosine-type recombinase/integrase [Kutzneria kofuensis]MBB5897776.1 site-specific recombinase XerD [Kutzneria kofuensis]